MGDDNGLEEAFRAGLQRRADGVDTTVDLLGPATSAARGQRRRRFLVTGSVGLAAAALVTAVVVQNTGDTGPGGDSTQVVDQGTSGPLPTEWRTEAWHGLQVEVPADWDWLAAPVDLGGELAWRGGPYDRPHVGRPVLASDACVGYDDSTPDAPYAWLGVDLPAGETDLGGGYTQVVVEVEGATLTVASDDARLTDRILESARPVEGCVGSIAGPPIVDSMLMEGLRDPSSAQVCAYRRADDSERYELVYATVLGATAATTYHAQVYDGGFENRSEFCGDSLELVLITITGADPYGGADVTQDTVVDPACREVSGSPGMVNDLSDRGMDAWARDGLPVTLSGLIGPVG